MTVLAIAVFAACAPSENSRTSPDEPLRRVILFNQDGRKTVGLMKDVDAMKVLVSMMAFPSDTTKAQFAAAQVEGTIFQVDSGTDLYPVG